MTTTRPHRRRSLFFTALAFLQLPPRAPELQILHRWLDNWRGIGHIVVGMERLGYTGLDQEVRERR